MNCKDRQDLMLLYLVDALDPTERDELRAHLESGCPTCASYLAEAEATTAHLAMALDPVQPRPEVRHRLMRRVKSQSGTMRLTPADRATPPTSPTPSTAPRGNWVVTGSASLAAAVLAASFTHLAVSIPANQQRIELEQLRAQVTQKNELVLDMRQRIETIDMTIQMLRSPSLKVVSLEGTTLQPEARARIFWDTTRRKWHFYAAGMQPAGIGKTYELWFITADEKKIAAGTFDVDETGQGSLLTDLPEDLGPLALAAVTDEPEGGVDQPTGTIQLVGKTN